LSILEANDLYSLAKCLGEKETTIKYLVFKSKGNYTPFFLFKRNGSKREIHAPIPMLKRIQRKIKNEIDLIYIKPNCVKGFCASESILSNAKEHVKKKNVFNIDLKDFFPSIHFGRIYGMFQSYPFKLCKEVSFYLAKLCTANDVMPQGAPTSPIISNVLSYKMDMNITNYCKKYNVSFTRYADDLSFSTNMNSFPRGLVYLENSDVKIGKILSRIINENGFEINPKKTKYFHNSVRQNVTNLTVNEKININKKYIRKIRSILFDAKTKGLESAAKKFYKIEYNIDISDISEKGIKESIEHYLNVLRGKLEFLRFVLKEQNLLFIKYAKEYNDLIGQDIFDNSFIDIVEYCSFRTYLIISHNEMSIGSGFITEEGYFITSTHVIFNKDLFISEEEYKNATNNLDIELDGKTDFIYFKQLGDKKKKILSNLKISKEAYDTDIYIQKRKFHGKKVKLAEKYDYKVNSKIYLVGFGGYIEGGNPAFISSTIINESKYLGRKYYQIKDRVIHGMSGGPVFNENKEVIGVVYCGLDNENSSVNGFIPINKELI
jgi:hypothetical protein